MLTDVKVAKLKYEGDRTDKRRLERHADRDGLYLAISPPRKSDPKAAYGSKTWRYDYRWPPSASGQRQTLTYGQYPALGLADARDKHREAKRDLAAGINPAAKKQDAKRGALTSLQNTYEKIAARWYELHSQGKSKSWKDNVSRWLKLTNDSFGSKPIQAVSENDVKAAVEPLVEAGNAFSAERVRQQTESVFAYAMKKRLFTGLNPAALLQGEIKVPPHKGHAHIREHEIPEFLAAVEHSKAAQQTKIAAKLLLLTFVRKQELLAAKRSELNIDAGIWEVPAERMKNRLPLLVPLSRQARELFQMQLAGTNGEYVFPSLSRPGRHAGLSTLNVFFDRIGFESRLTPHGLRAVASTKLNGMRRFSGDVIELQLSHREKNHVRGAYNKADHLEERTAMMQLWADHIDQLCQPRGDNVMSLHAA